MERGCPLFSDGVGYTFGLCEPKEDFLKSPGLRVLTIKRGRYRIGLLPVVGPTVPVSPGLGLGRGLPQDVGTRSFAGHGHFRAKTEKALGKRERVRSSPSL